MARIELALSNVFTAVVKFVRSAFWRIPARSEQTASMECDAFVLRSHTNEDMLCGISLTLDLSFHIPFSNMCAVECHHRVAVAGCARRRLHARARLLVSE